MLKLGNTEINALGNDINKAYLGAIEVFGNQFISLWETTTDNETITLPTTTTTYRVDWGDGTVTNNTNSHEYALSGQYTIKISGNITDLAFNDLGDKDKILNVSKFGGVDLISGSFHGCSNLNVTALTTPTTGNTLIRSFSGCSSLVYNPSISDIDVSLVTSFQGLFRNCVLFNQPLSWTTLNLTDCQLMFLGCSIFNQPLSFYTDNVNTMRQMFNLATNFNSTLTFNTVNVTDMESMFNEASNFNQPINFNTASVTTCRLMFNKAFKFNQPINFISPLLEDCSSMFFQCSEFNSSVTIDTSSVTTMNSMFYLCSVFNQPLNFNTSLVESFKSMFLNCVQFNQPLNFDTSLVEDMSNMLRGTASFNQDISSWSFVSVTNMNNFMIFKGAEYDVNYMDNLYIKLDQDLVFANMVDVNINFGSINYTSNGAAARASLVSKGFIITSGIQV